MSTVSSTPFAGTMAELLDRLGVTPDRVLLDPPPGTATENDLLRVTSRRDRLYELVEGTLVEKPMGYQESSLAAHLITLLGPFVRANKLGNLATADGTMRLMPGLVRIPDVSFVRWEKLPGRVVPDTPIPDLVPDLAVEVLSKRNKPPEVRRKCREYFLSGVEVVWLIDPRRRTVAVSTADDPEKAVIHAEGDTLDGGAVLPGLALAVTEIFELVPPAPPAKPGGKRKKSG